MSLPAPMPQWATLGTNIDSIVDSSTTDSDTLTITGTDDVTFGTVTNVETINVDLEKVNGAAFNIDVGELLAQAQP